MEQNIKLLEHNKFERKNQQLTFPIEIEIVIPQDDPVRMASAQLEELDYRQLRINRSIQVEGAFGVLKSDRKFKRFLTRGRTNISTELYLLCLGYNLNKLWAKCNANRLKTHLFSVKKE
jgi:transposase